MTKIGKFLLFILMINYSCSSDSILQEDIIDENKSSNKINLKINGQPPVNSIRDINAAFCCEKKLSLSFNHWIDLGNGSGYGGSAFQLSLDKQGNILGLWYKDYTHPNNEFYNANFVPISTLSVENFEFVENNYLKLKISGILFKKTYNFFIEPETIQIDVEFEINQFINCACNLPPNYIDLNNEFVFYDIYRWQQGNNIAYLGHTINGYQIEFKNFLSYFKEMPNGVYSFDENTTSERIDFRKFIGIPRQFSHIIINEEWIKYDTSGTFEILEKYQIDGNTITKIRFNLTAKENGIVVYEFNDAIFETPW